METRCRAPRAPDSLDDGNRPLGDRDLHAHLAALSSNWRRNSQNPNTPMARRRSPSSACAAGRGGRLATSARCLRGQPIACQRLCSPASSAPRLSPTGASPAGREPMPAVSSRQDGGAPPGTVRQDRGRASADRRGGSPCQVGSRRGFPVGAPSRFFSNRPSARPTSAARSPEPARRSRFLAARGKTVGGRDGGSLGPRGTARRRGPAAAALGSASGAIAGAPTSTSCDASRRTRERLRRHWPPTSGGNGMPPQRGQPPGARTPVPGEHADRPGGRPRAEWPDDPRPRAVGPCGRIVAAVSPAVNFWTPSGRPSPGAWPPAGRQFVDRMCDKRLKALLPVRRWEEPGSRIRRGRSRRALRWDAVRQLRLVTGADRYRQRVDGVRPASRARSTPGGRRAGSSARRAAVSRSAESTRTTAASFSTRCWWPSAGSRGSSSHGPGHYREERPGPGSSRRTAPSFAGWSGYGRLEGVPAAEALARPYSAARLFVNVFQPSFKLAEKTRHGAVSGSATMRRRRRARACWRWTRFPVATKDRLGRGARYGRPARAVGRDPRRPASSRRPRRGGDGPTRASASR